MGSGASWQRHCLYGLLLLLYVIPGSPLLYLQLTYIACFPATLLPSHRCPAYIAVNLPEIHSYHSGKDFAFMSLPTKGASKAFHYLLLQRSLRLHLGNPNLSTSLCLSCHFPSWLQEAASPCSPWKRRLVSPHITLTLNSCHMAPDCRFYDTQVAKTIVKSTTPSPTNTQARVPSLSSFPVFVYDTEWYPSCFDLSSILIIINIDAFIMYHLSISPIPTSAHLWSLLPCCIFMLYLALQGNSGLAINYYLLFLIHKMDLEPNICNTAPLTQWPFCSQRSTLCKDGRLLGTVYYRAITLNR